MRSTRRQSARAFAAVLTALGACAALAGGAQAAPSAPYFTALPASGGTQLTEVRSYATATTLPSGRVLIAGGYNGGFLSTLETFDAAVPTFAGLPGADERAYAVAAPLPGGKVLIAGGYPTFQLQTATIFDAGSNTLTPLPAAGSTQLTVARAGAVAAPLPGGKALIAGGTPNFPPVGAVRSAELFDPATNTFTALPASGSTQLTVARRGAVAAPLPDGKVLIAGGTESLDTPPILRSAELFDPATNTFTALPASGTTQLATARITAAATALPDGRLLIAGGSDGTDDELRRAELFDPATMTFSALPASGTTQLATGRRSLVAAALPDGTVLIAGGATALGTHLRSAELFVPAPSARGTGGNFGEQTVGQASAVRDVTVTNLGAQTLDIGAGAPAVSSDSGAAGDFALVGQTCAGAHLAFRGTCTLSVRFTPAAAGVRTAGITFGDNGAGGTTTVALTGTGVPVAPAPTPQGGQPAGTAAPAGTPAGTPAPPAAKPKARATCAARRSRRTGRTRISCTVTGLAAKAARARLSRNGNGVASGRMTASGRLVLTTGRRVRAGTYRLTVGTTKLTVRIR